MSSEQDKGEGWQLSQDQFKFIEETLKDALLAQVDRRVEELRGAQQRLLDEALQHVDDRLNEVVASPSAGGTDEDPQAGNADVLPDFERMVAEVSAEQTEATKRFFLEEVERRLNESREATEDRLRSLGGEVEAHLGVGGAAGRQRSRDRKMLAGMAVVLALFGAATFYGMELQAGRVLDRRAERLVELRGSADATLAEMAARSREVDSIGRALASDADAIREIASAEGLRAGIVNDLTADGSFLSSVTGPPGPAGPPGPPPDNISYGSGSFSFFNPSAVTVATIGQTGEGNGHTRLNNRSGDLVAYLGADARGDGVARVAAGSGATEVMVQAAGDSGSVVVDGGRGARAYLGTVGGTQARLQVSNATGDGGVTIRSEGGLGAVLVNGRSIADFAEVFELATREDVAPGTVMSMAADGGGLVPSGGAYDRRVVGVVSGAGGLRAGMVLGTRADGSTDLPIAISGQVYVRVSNEGGAIAVGDLLVASGSRGVAMRAASTADATGAVIGKALEEFGGADSREGLVRMLVMTR